MALVIQVLLAAGLASTAAWCLLLVVQVAKLKRTVAALVEQLKVLNSNLPHTTHTIAEATKVLAPRLGGVDIDRSI